MRAPPAGVAIKEWRPLQRGALRGFAVVEMPSGMILYDVTIFSGIQGLWASPPSKPAIGKDGAPVVGHNGKPKYNPVVAFRDRATQQRWSDSVCEALLLAHPDADTPE